MSHLGDNHLLCVASEHCRGKLDAKEKALYLSGQPTSFSYSLQILDEKCVEFSPELNGTLLRFVQ